MLRVSIFKYWFGAACIKNYYYPLIEYKKIELAEKVALKAFWKIPYHQRQ